MSETNLNRRALNHLDEIRNIVYRGGFDSPRKLLGFCFELVRLEFPHFREDMFFNYFENNDTAMEFAKLFFPNWTLDHFNGNISYNGNTYKPPDDRVVIRSGRLTVTGNIRGMFPSRVMRVSLPILICAWTLYKLERYEGRYFKKVG